MGWKKVPCSITILHLEVKKFHFRVTVWHARKWEIPTQTPHGFIFSTLLCCCQCLSLLCFHLSALGRKPEGNRFRMEETSKTECSLSKLKISPCQSPPPPSHCHFHFISLSFLLCLPLCVLKLFQVLAHAKLSAWQKSEWGQMMTAVSEYFDKQSHVLVSRH